MKIMDRTIFIGNLSTLIKIAIITIFPAATVYFSEDLLLAVITGFVGLAFSYIDAKYPNTIIESPKLQEQAIEYEAAGEDGI